MANYPEHYRIDRHYDDEAYKSVRGILLEMLREYRYAVPKLRQPFREGLVRLRYGHYHVNLK